MHEVAVPYGFLSSFATMQKWIERGNGSVKLPDYSFIVSERAGSGHDGLMK